MRNRIIKSVVRWGLEIIIRVVAFIEGFVTIFAQGEACGGPPPAPPCPGGPSAYGLSLDDLSQIFVSLITFPIDLLMADASILCSVLNPPVCPLSDPCCCYLPAFFSYVGPVIPGPIDCRQCIGPVGLECTVLLPFFFPTCSVPGGPPGEDCIDKELVSCDPDNANQLDGILIAVLRYFRCMLSTLFGGGGEIVDVLIAILVIVWQISDAVLRFLAGAVMFVFFMFTALGGDCNCHNEGLVVQRGGLCYPCEEAPPTCGIASTPTNVIVIGSGTSASCFDTVLGIDTPNSFDTVCSIGGANSEVLCSVLDVIGAGFTVFQSFLDIFTTPPILPTTPAKRAYADTRFGTRQGFKKKMESTRGQHNIYHITNVVDAMFEALWGYSIDDCLTDCVGCLCRNMDMQDICTWDNSTQSIAMEVTTTQVLDAMAEHMQGNTVCDHVIRNCAGTTWANVPYAEKVEYVDCLDKIIQGERLNMASSYFPPDFFIIHDGPYQLYKNLEDGVLDGVRSVRTKQIRREQANEADPTWVRRNKIMKRHIENRRANIYREAAKDKRWKGSMTLTAFAKFDEFEYKFRSGYYARLFHGAYRNFREGTWQAPVWPALKNLGSETANLGSTLRRIKWREAADLSYKAVNQTIRATRVLMNKGPWAIFMEMRERVHNLPENVASREKAEKMRKMVQDAFYNGPFYKWWTSSWQTYENPFRRFAEHIRATVKWNRDNWQRTKANAFNMDLHVKHRLSSVSRRWEKRWTPEKLANWESLGRVFWKGYAGIWPAQVSKEVQERFLINCNCLLMDGFIDQVIFLTGYCVNTFMPNLPPFKRRQLAETSPFFRNLEIMAARSDWHRHHRVYIPEKQLKEVTEGPHSTEENWVSWFDWFTHRTQHWARYRVRPAVDTAKRERHKLFQYLNHQQWARLAMGAPFHLVNWFACLIDMLLATNLTMELDMFIMDLEAFFMNDNIDFMAGPVGFKYW